MDITLLQEVLDLVPVDYWPDSLLGSDIAVNSLIVAQQFKDTLGDDFVAVWNKFIESGQVWALLIGIVVGYVMRTFTSF
jgi:hypothetical protein